MIRAIVAIDEQRGVAKDGNIPWDIPIDSEYWKTTSQTGITIMGRTTYERFSKPLPNRRNVVASSNLTSLRDGFDLLADVGSFLQTTKDDVWIIGGAKLYESLLDYCDELYITLVSGSYDCDRFFPEYEAKFTLKAKSEVQSQNGYQFSFAIYTKKPTAV